MFFVFSTAILSLILSIILCKRKSLKLKIIDEDEKINFLGIEFYDERGNNKYKKRSFFDENLVKKIEFREKSEENLIFFKNKIVIANYIFKKKKKKILKN